MSDNKFKLGLALAREKVLEARIAALESTVAPIVREFEEYDRIRYEPVPTTYNPRNGGKPEENGVMVRVRLMRALCASVGPVDPQKYDDTLLPFLALMRKELHANSHKGDRNGWLGMSSGTAIGEVSHHGRKLAAAVARSDIDAIKEHAADVANCAMMLLDVYGGLGRA